jgi:hydroxyacylglutathione hydrolase
VRSISFFHKSKIFVGGKARNEDNLRLEEVMEFTSQTENPQFPEVLDLDPQEVQEKQEQLTLIDVRRPDEYIGELGHIPGAQLLTLDQLPMKIDSLPQDKPIVFICRSGARSAQAASFALENGFETVFNMRGGMILWNEYGFDTEP